MSEIIEPSTVLKEQPYHTSHSWHYVLGGDILTPKQIFEEVRTSDFERCLSYETREIDRMAAPKRYERARVKRQEVIADLRADFSRYREVVFALRALRKSKGLVFKKCHEEHVSVSLKYSHIYNRAAHLIYLDNILNKQPSLFGLDY